jgi:hypothetical protein
MSILFWLNAEEFPSIISSIGLKKSGRQIFCGHLPIPRKQDTGNEFRMNKKEKIYTCLTAAWMVLIICMSATPGEESSDMSLSVGWFLYRIFVRASRAGRLPSADVCGKCRFFSSANAHTQRNMPSWQSLCGLYCAAEKSPLMRKRLRFPDWRLRFCTHVPMNFISCSSRAARGGFRM